MSYRFDRAALARVVPVGASIAVHVALLGAAATAVPGVRVLVPEMLMVDLVAVEPAPPAVQAATAPPPPKPKPLTLPKPIAPPIPKLEPLPAPVAPEPDRQPVQAPPPLVPPAAATAPTAPAEPAPPAAPAVSARSTLASASPGLPAVGRALDSGVSRLESSPAQTGPTLASIPPGRSITTDARPTGGYQVRPTYPASAKRLGVEGTTLLRVQVLENGRVGGLEVEHSAGHRDLDQAAIDAVRRWRFDPARRGEEAVAMWVRLPVEFRLR